VAVPHGTPGCSASACHVTCDQGFVDADGQYPNGCELDVRTDLANCGGAGVVCAPGPHVATAACVAGICGVGTCTQGFADCDGVASNGCEVDLQNTATHCGACGTACTALPNATPACAAGQCVPQCQAGFANCDGASANGCEVPLNTASNCGACGGVCTPPNGTGSCSTGSCQVVGCAPGFADCNLNATDGCEANLASASTCGSCSNTCGGPNAMYQCVGSACHVAACAPGFSDCDASPATGCEVHTAVDPNNCGSCGTACSTNHATSSCTNGTCSVAACAPGFADCDNNAINGCELSISNNPTNCGGCNVVCSTANGTPNCAQGQCTVAACNPGFSDCDLNAATGCETHTATDPINCGSCGNVCSVNHGTAGCASGACSIAVCNPGFRDCDGQVANGCEINSTIDRNNCGGCAVVCAASKNCVNSICQ
jgi:hypothetical protein